MTLPNDHPDVLARQIAKKPEVKCNLFDNHYMDCDICRELFDMPDVNKNYTSQSHFCVAKYIQKILHPVMKTNNRNISIGWANNYLTERVQDDNMASGEGSGVILPPEIKPEGNTVGLDCKEAERTTEYAEHTEEYETKDAVGEVCKVMS